MRITNIFISRDYANPEKYNFKVKVEVEGLGELEVGDLRLGDAAVRTIEKQLLYQIQKKIGLSKDIDK